MTVFSVFYSSSHLYLIHVPALVLVSQAPKDKRFPHDEARPPPPLLLLPPPPRFDARSSLWRPRQTNLDLPTSVASKHPPYLYQPQLGMSHSPRSPPAPPNHPDGSYQAVGALGWGIPPSLEQWEPGPGHSLCLYWNLQVQAWFCAYG